MTTVEQQATEQVPTEWYKVSIGCGIKRRNYDFSFGICLVNIYNWFKYVLIAFTVKYQ